MGCVIYTEATSEGSASLRGGVTIIMGTFRSKLEPAKSPSEIALLVECSFKGNVYVGSFRLGNDCNAAESSFTFAIFPIELSAFCNPATVNITFLMISSYSISLGPVLNCTNLHLILNLLCYFHSFFH